MPGPHPVLRRRQVSKQNGVFFVMLSMSMMKKMLELFTDSRECSETKKPASGGRLGVTGMELLLFGDKQTQAPIANRA